MKTMTIHGSIFRGFLASALALSTLALGAAPASAAGLCLQFSGGSCALSGDLGFFAFPGAKAPKTPTKAVGLHGRACGTGTASGAMAVTSDASSVHLSATFVCDATFGVITADFAPGSVAVGATSTNAYASYGGVGLDTSCTATVVDCDDEP